MKRLAAALLVLAGVAAADEIQTVAPAFCNGQAYCSPAVSALALDAGLEQAEGNFAAAAIGGNANAPHPTCVPQAGGWWQSCVVLVGDDLSGTIVLNNGDGGHNPVFVSGSNLATVIPGRPFTNGGSCLAQIGNLDAGQFFQNPSTVRGLWFDGGCNVLLVQAFSGSAPQLDHGIAYNYFMVRQ